MFNRIVSAICVSVLVSGSLAGAEPPRVKPAKETTYFTEPLRENGTVDYAAALNRFRSRGVTLENNAAVPLAEVFGPGVIDAKYQQAYFKKLGVSVPPTDREYFKPVGNLYLNILNPRSDPVLQSKIVAIRKEFEIAENREWSPQECPFVFDWLNSNASFLAAAEKAIRRPRFYEPVLDPIPENSDFLDWASQGTWLPTPELSKAFRARFWLRMGRGDSLKAADDILNLSRVARIHAQSPGKMKLLIAYRDDAVAWHHARQLMTKAGLDSPGVRLFAESVRQLPPLPDPRETVSLWDRIHCICSAMQRAAKEPVAAALDEEDWSVILGTINRHFDKLVACRSKREYQMLVESYPLGGNHIPIHRLFSAFHKPRVIGTRLALHYGDFSWDISGRRMQALDAVLTTALAIRDFAETTKRRPVALAELVPEYLPAVPNDPIDGEPLRYELTFNSYLVYSIGGNGVDERGFDWQVKPGADDIPILLALPESPGEAKRIEAIRLELKRSVDSPSTPKEGIRANTKRTSPPNPPATVEKPTIEDRKTADDSARPTPNIERETAQDSDSPNWKTTPFAVGVIVLLFLAFIVGFWLLRPNR